MSDSPASQPDITELFARDPLKLSDQDLDAIIAKVRWLREMHNLGKRLPKPKKDNLTLDDIGL